MRLPLEPKLLERIKTHCQSQLEKLVSETIAVCQIPAPSLLEQDRAAYVLDRLKPFCADVYSDEVGNVIGYIPGQPHKPTLMLAAHMDTVFPIETDVTVRREGDQLFAPGVRDNSTAVAALIVLAESLQQFTEQDIGDLYLVGTVGEEGLGDLKGMRAAYEQLKDKVDYCIAVDGGFGGIVNAGIASRRFNVTCTAGGGHSWGNFGVPSAIHALGHMIAGIDEIQVPKNPRTSYNVGVIEGGNSVNSIAGRASMLIDMRSVENQSLHVLEKQVRTIIKDVSHRHDVNAEIEVVGDRPGGSLSQTHHLVVSAEKVLSYLGMSPRFNASSTDANIPLSQGTPAICIGVTTGHNTHRLDESLDIPPLSRGLEQLMLLVFILEKQ